MPVQTTYGHTPDAAIVGQCDNGTYRSGDFRTMFNGAAPEIAFGRAVRYGSVTDARDARLPAAETDKIVGLLAHSHSYENGPNGDLGTVGVKQGGKLNVLRKGRMWVINEDAVVPGDPVWVRAVASGDPEFLGGLTNADDGTDTIQIPGTWQSASAAGAGAWVEINLP